MIPASARDAVVMIVRKPLIPVVGSRGRHRDRRVATRWVDSLFYGVRGDPSIMVGAAATFDGGGAPCSRATPPGSTSLARPAV